VSDFGPDFGDDFGPAFSGGTTVTSLGGLGSYLYVQYQDDDDLQAFVAAYNQLANIYVMWFGLTPLPAYTSSAIVGALLDLVAAGIYGMIRPSLSSGLNRDLGPFNTYGFNTLEFGRRRLVGPNNVTVTTDDIFKRIVTWRFYKGDGNTFNIRWLKRRIVRFLIGADGAAPNVDSTYNISVTYGPGIISIRIAPDTRTILGGALFNRTGFNVMPTAAYNDLVTKANFVPNPYQYAPQLQEAMNSGVLLLPFQYKFVLTI